MKAKSLFITTALQMIVLAVFNLLTPASASAIGNVVISQVFGGGGGTGYYRYDYVELYNRSDTAATLTGWSLQYASASGNFTGGNLLYAIPSGTVIPPGGYLLVQCGSAGTSGISFPVTPDLVTANLNISQASGKVSLANIATQLGTVSLLPDSRIVDFVGFGAANLAEGGTTANGGIALNNQQGCVRKAAGWQDTDNNNTDFDVVTQPVPRNSTTGKISFFPTNLLPPTNGMYVAQQGRALYANGVIISNVAHRIFTSGILPPSPGVSANDSYSSTLEFDLSMNSGLTWSPVILSSVPTTMLVGSNATVGGYAVYSNAVTSWVASGGSLPAGVMIRESPTLSSPGQTRVSSIPGGYMISSFFDIFTEVSTDNGNTWQPTTNGPVHMELRPDPALVSAAPAPRTVMPMPNGQYISPRAAWQSYANGFVIKDVRQKLFMTWMEPPLFGTTNTQTFSSQSDFQLSTDGGNSFMHMRAPATMTVKISNIRGFQNQSTYETEVPQFDITGGDLPVGVMIRESPTKASQGGTSSLAGGGGGGAGGGAAISSFFDIFTEVSPDGGQTWQASTNGPAHMELQRIGPANLFTNNLLPPLAGEYFTLQQWWAYYANGIVITNVVNYQFTAAITPPLPGFSASHTFGSELEFDISYDGGLTYSHTITRITEGFHITARLGDDGTTVYYDTEMVQFDTAGVTLPGGIQIRESPTKASLGRTTYSAVVGGNGGYQIDSFFDIFTEVSTDGGQTWQATIAGPGLLTLRPRSPTISVLNLTCPTNMTVMATNPAGAVGTFAPTVSGTCPPFTTNCAPPSGSTFPIGNTVVNCTANDSCGNSTNCSFMITVVPKPLTITCPSNITVRATSAAGAVVNYVVTTSGGCPPITVTCVPASGSTFPIGATVVNCTATDACGQQVNCSFRITVLRQLQKRFYQQNLLPPTNGMFVPPAPGVVTFPGGIIISNFTHRVFSAGAVPPTSLGASITHSFDSQVEMDISFDGGISWKSCVESNAPAQMDDANSGLDSGDALYGEKLLQLNVSGGSFPVGVMIRESPTLASAGETRIEATPGGYMIDSFFDIYLEVSTDGGGSYMPASAPLRLELKPDPQLIPPALAPRKVLPMPNGQYISSGQSYANGIVLKDVKKKLFTGWMEPPVFSASQTHTFDSQLDFEFSTDGGNTFTAARAPATMTFTINNVRGFQGRNTYDTEVTQFDVAGGDLPVGVMIRESPTKASKGGTSSMAGGGGGGAGGGAAISSFFDIFTEVSTDGGGVWYSATNGPAHMETRRIAPVYTYTNNLFPALTGEYYCQQQWFAYYANGIVITNFLNHAFSAAITPPLPGLSTVHTFGSQVEFDVSYDGGLTYSHATSSATDGVQITCRLGDDGVTKYYDTELTQLSISGGGLPANIQIRESPTKASLGRTTMSVNGLDNDCDSFFDIYTEVSTDGGFSWYPTVAGPGTVMLRPRAPSSPLTITCPSNITVRATSAAGAVVTYPAPTIRGGCSPYTTNCVPPSGSTFAIGVTVVNCSVTDVCGGNTNCSFTVTVLRQLQKRFFTQNLLPPGNGMYVPPATSVLTYPGGIIISNVALRVASAGVAPPTTLGGNVTYSFSTTMELEVSFNGGLTWQSCVMSNAPAQTYAINNGLDAVDTLYGGELQQLTVSGGTLPAGVMIRESPTKASTGETRIETIAGGYMIDSFFDIYLEVSTDGGGTWKIQDGDAALQGQLNEQAELITPALAPRTVLPMPNGQYVSLGQSYANGIVLKDVKKKLFTGWMEPPLFGAAQTHTFDSQLDFQLSTDGGAHFTAARAPATTTFTISNVREFQGRKTYETEVTQLDVAGGDLPVGVMIRESPTKASKGGTSSLPGGGGGGAGGGAAISSFFDIFTEVSTDGGGSWNPATNGPAHMETRRIAPVYTYTNNLFPPLTGQYYCPQQWFAYYANGIVITNFLNHAFTAAITPPLPGLSTSHTFGSTVEFDVSYDGGLTYNHATAPATDGIQITCRLGDDGVTKYYDAEMTQLSISGGGLPANVQIRESPTKASLGRTTMSANGTDNDCDSFFDIYTEVSTDGGLSWIPSVAGPGTTLLKPQIVPVTPATITGIVLVSGGCTLNYTNGGGLQFILLASPTLTAAMSTWAPVATNTTGAGSFTVTPTATTFYRVKSQ